MVEFANGGYLRLIGKSEVSFTIPQCLANGDYLFRIEHVALHRLVTYLHACFTLIIPIPSLPFLSLSLSIQCSTRI